MEHLMVQVDHCALNVQMDIMFLEAEVVVLQLIPLLTLIVFKEHIPIQHLHVLNVLLVILMIVIALV